MNEPRYAPRWRGRYRNREVNHRFLNWLTTAPHPTRPAHTHGADQGQVGWKRHYVMAHSSKLNLRPGRPALCGLRPKHGWGFDMFIDAPCGRCIRAAVKRGLTLDAFL